MTVSATRPHVVMMGVSGNGKTTVGEALAAELGYVFIEGDSYHPRSNVEKMSAGIPLDDADRRPWLETLGTEIARQDALGRRTVTACSALRRRYRDWLRSAYPGLFFLLLDAPYDVLLERMKQREHFMPPSLLRSQFETLEPLADDEAHAVIDNTQTPEAVVTAAVEACRIAG